MSPYLCGYRKGFNSQDALISLTVRWRKSLDDKGYRGAVLLDLSKAFDTLNYDLLIAKLHAYGFGIKTLNCIVISQKSGKEQKQIQVLVHGLSCYKTSIRVLFLHLICLNDLFYLTEMTQVCNFADDTTFYVCDKDLNTLISRLEYDTAPAVEWFENNFIKLNQDKCHLLVSGHKHETVWAKIGKTKIWESNKQKLFGAVIDGNLNFDENVFDLSKKSW